MDRLDFYYKQKVTEAQLDDAFDKAEQADFDQMIDLDFVGILSGLSVQAVSPTPNLNVRVVGPGVAYDAEGQRCYVPSTQTVDLSVDSSAVSTAVASPGNEKIVSVFLKFDRATSDPQTDGNSNTVLFVRDASYQFFVKQGSEGSAPATPPTLESDGILLADVRRSHSQTQIQNTDITPPGGSYSGISNRRQDAFVYDTGTIELRANTPLEAISDVLQELSDHVTSVANVHPATAVDYGGGNAWADGTTNPAATLEAQIDKMIDDLRITTSTGGAAKIGVAAVAGSPTSLSAGTLAAAISTILSAINARARLASTESVSGDWTFTNTINTTPSGGAADPALNDTRALGVGMTLIAQFGINGGTIKARLYANPIAFGSGQGFALTYNVNHTTGTSATLDDTGSVGWVMLFGSGGIDMRLIASGAGTKDLTAPANRATYPLYTTTDHVGTNGGVWINDDQISCRVGGSSYCSAGSQAVNFTTTFPKRFPSAPASFTFTTVSHVNLGTGPFANDATEYGVTFSGTSSGAGVTVMIDNVLVS